MVADQLAEQIAVPVSIGLAVVTVWIFVFLFLAMLTEPGILETVSYEEPIADDTEQRHRIKMVRLLEQSAVS